MKKQIKSLSGSVLFEYECKTTSELLEAAIKSRADLSRADLSRANLYCVNLSGVNLSGADLSRANLYGADLSRADLSRADLSGANLYGADLSRADLSRADLSGANLYCVNLSGVNLSGADLSGADLYRANLYGAKNADLIIAKTRILPEGDIIGYKKCRNDVVVKLLIPKEAKRSSAFGRKCRAEYAQVLEIYGASEAISKERADFIYRVGETVSSDKWDDNWMEECSHGIHFFITKIEAENY